MPPKALKKEGTEGTHPNGAGASGLSNAKDSDIVSIDVSIYRVAKESDRVLIETGHFIPKSYIE